MPTSYSLAASKQDALEFRSEVANPISSDTGTRLIIGYLRVLVRHRVLLLCCLCATLLLSAGLTFIAHPAYEAVTLIGVDLTNRDLLGNEKPATTDGTDVSMRLETQLRLAQSDIVAEQVIRELHLTTNCTFSETGCRGPAVGLDQLPHRRRASLLASYHAGLQAEILPRTQLMALHFRSRDPELAAAVVNAVAAAYIDQSFRTQVESLQKASMWLNTQLEDVRRQAEAAQARLVAYQQQVGLIGTDEKNNVLTNRVDELNRELSTTESDRIVKEARYRVAESGDPELIGEAVPDSVIHTLRKQQADLQAQYSALNARYDENYPKLTELSRQLRDIQVLIHHEVDRIRTQMQEQYDAARRSESMLQSALDQQKREAMHVDAAAVQYAILQEDVQTSRDLYESLVKRLKEASIDQGLRSSDLQLLDHAEVPSFPVSPRLSVNLILGFVSGVLIGIVAAFVRESFDQSVRSPDEIETLSALPVLGVIPHVPRGQVPRIKLIQSAGVRIRDAAGLPVALAQPASQAVEAYRTFRTTLLTTGMQYPRVICFVSGSGQEGKSTTAVNTSIVLAQQGNRVLLVDADLRCPTLHKHLHVPGDVGLSDALMDVTAEAPISTVQGGSLFFLPAGTSNRLRYVSESLGSPRMKQLIHSWRDRYDFVIIDTPPLRAFTDGVVISGWADTAVIVTRFTETSRDTLRHVKQLLERAKVRVSGVVLNDVHLSAADYGSYYDQRSFQRYEKANIA